MLVPIAIGGFVLSFAFDIACWISGAQSPNLWNEDGVGVSGRD